VSLHFLDCSQYLHPLQFSGHAMLYQPPQTELFSEIHEVGIHPEVLRYQLPYTARRNAGAAARTLPATPQQQPVVLSRTPGSIATSLAVPTSATPGSAIGEVTSLLTAMSSLIGLRQPGAVSLEAPKTPRRVVSSPIPSPAVTPSLMSRFVDYASSKGVPDMEFYRVSLEQKHYGPDVLPEVPDAELTDLGISAGKFYLESRSKTLIIGALL
jgi:hypothetical protein